MQVVEHACSRPNSGVHSRVIAGAHIAVYRGAPFSAFWLRVRDCKATLRLVRHRAFPHWAVICFLVSRLIFGEFAHAMPHASAQVNGDVALADEAGTPCPDHLQPPPSTHSEASGSDAAKSGGHPLDDKDCCKNGGCACPCLHTPAATPTSALTVTLTHEARPGVVASGAAWLRSSPLFRPPA